MKKFDDKQFWNDANKFLACCKRLGAQPKGAFQSPAVLNHLYSGVNPNERAARFKDHWEAYLRAMNLTKDTLIDHGCLPHCRTIGGTWEESRCQWNPHTELCRQYKKMLEQQFTKQELLKLEKSYREWRKNYLAGPRKPSFRYPSRDDLPMPKIFGRSFYEVDLDRSIVRLRLDDMSEGQWLEFGFKPWPRDYQPSKEEVRERITSVHVHFVGARARVGFRFDVSHQPSRFNCTQDQIDKLRSREFPVPLRIRSFWRQRESCFWKTSRAIRSGSLAFWRWTWARPAPALRFSRAESFAVMFL